MQATATFQVHPGSKVVPVNRNPFPRKRSLKTAGRQGLPYLALCWFASTLMILFMSHAHADEVIMKNGDRLQGEVVSMEGGKLIFKTPYADKNVIPWDQVESLTTEKTLEVSLPDKETLTGKAVTAEDGTLVLQPETGPATAPIPMEQVTAMAPPKPPEGWKFSASLSAGMNIQHGNTEERDFHGDVTLGLMKLPHRFKFYGQLNNEKGGDPLIATENNWLTRLDYDRFLSEKWYLFGVANAQHDKFADLDLLWFVAAGAGYQFWRSERKNLSLKIGPAYVSEHYTKPMVNMDNKDYRRYAAGFWTVDFDIWLIEKLLQGFHHNSGYLSFEDSDVWRIRTRTGVRMPIIHGFFTALQYNYDWANSPADGKLHYDSQILFKVGWDY